MQSQATDVWCTMTEKKQLDDEDYAAKIHHAQYLEHASNMEKKPREYRITDIQIEGLTHASKAYSELVLRNVHNQILPDTCTDDTCIYKRFSKNMENAERHDQQIRTDERNKVMDEFGILHGDDAKRFHDYMDNPDPGMSPDAKKLIKEAFDRATEEMKKS